MKIDHHLKDVFEFAKQMELDGKGLYERELKHTTDPGLQNILQMLIKAEQNHYEIFDNMQKGKKVKIVKTDFGKVKNIFQKMQDSGQVTVQSKDHAKFYEKLHAIEEKAEKFYRKEAENTSDEEVKKALLEIADEEHRHVVLMANMKKFVSRPKQWVEDAEFNHMDEY